MYSTITYSPDGVNELVDRVSIDPSEYYDHDVALQAKLDELRAIHGVTKFTVATTYQSDVEFVTDRPEPAPVVNTPPVDDGGSYIV